MCLRFKLSWYERVEAYVQGKAGEPSGADGRKTDSTTPFYLNRELLDVGVSDSCACDLENIH
jgi:hypothetical protein